MQTDDDFESFDFILQTKAVSPDDLQVSVFTSTGLNEASTSKHFDMLHYFFSTAHASCVAPVAVSASVIENIDVQSNVMINSDFPAGISLNDILEINFVDSGDVGSVQSHRTTLSRTAVFIPLADFASSSAPAPFAFNLKFTDVAVVDTTHEFTITYSSRNGDVFSLTTGGVLLRNFD